MADGLCRMTTRLVDRSQAPGCQKRALPGVPTDMLAGRPADERFGAMAWQEHITGRHAMLARQYLMFYFSDSAPGTVPQSVPMVPSCFGGRCPAGTLPWPSSLWPWTNPG
eukprot:352901-Chlamydomonas_euryale.AAC.1